MSIVNTRKARDDILLICCRTRNIDQRHLNQAQKIFLKQSQRQKPRTEVNILLEQLSFQRKPIIDSSHGFSNDSHHAKGNSISDEEGKSNI